MCIRDSVKAKTPFPRQLAYFVAGVEFVCGSLLTIGFLSGAACLALLIDMTVATLTNAVSTPVSYTHLDVYKRQLPEGRGNHRAS